MIERLPDRLIRSVAFRCVALRCVVVALLLVASTAGAQSWTASVTGAWVEQSVDGSEGSFRSQWNLDDGFLLEALALRYKPEGESGRELDFEAWGFGGAELAEGARLAWRPGHDWRFGASYRRTESFFQLAAGDLDLRRDDWEITRFDAELEWTGWKAADLTLSAGHVERSGLVTQPFNELNHVYLLGVDLDETRQETALRLETKTLPVKIVFEQSLTQLERKNHWFPAGDATSSPNLFVDTRNDREEERDIPVSRLIATWAGSKVEVTGAFLLSDGDFDAVGASSSSFAISGGAVGTLSFVDDLLASSSFETTAAQVRVGIRLAPRWKLLLAADSSDRQQDSTLLGQRLLRVANPVGGTFDIPLTLDDTTLFDVKDEDLRAEVRHDRDHVKLWFGVLDTSRDVEWDLGEDPDSFSGRAGFGVDRTSDGFFAGAAFDVGERSEATVEYETGSFEEYVFRTDPESVDRIKVRFKTSFEKGFGLRLRGRFEEADNPAFPAAGLDRSSDAYGAGLFWASEDGKSDFALDLDVLDLRSETGLILPGGEPGLSLYDLSLTTLSLNGRTEVGKLLVSGSLHWLEDSGDTWPLQAWDARARLAYPVAKSLEVAVFGQLFSYDEDLRLGDDFDVTRFGVAFSWRYE